MRKKPFINSSLLSDPSPSNQQTLESAWIVLGVLIISFAVSLSFPLSQILVLSFSVTLKRSLCALFNSLWLAQLVAWQASAFAWVLFVSSFNNNNNNTGSSSTLSLCLSLSLHVCLSSLLSLLLSLVASYSSHLRTGYKTATDAHTNSLGLSPLCLSEW